MPPSSDSNQYRFLRLFQEVTRLITSSLELDEVLSRIVSKIPGVIGVDAATIRLIDSSGKKLLLLAAHGLSDTYLNRGPVDAEESVIEALQGSPVAITDATSDPRISYTEAAKAEGVRSILVAPIPIRSKIQGVLRLLTRKPRQFDAAEIEFVAAVAEQCGIALENAIAYQRIAKLVTELEHQQEERLARERLQGVLEMAGAAAHELNSPVFAALGNAQLALASVNPNTPLHHELETVVNNLKEVSELTHKMTRITRYESKDYAGNVKIVDIQKSSRPTESGKSDQ